MMVILSIRENEKRYPLPPPYLFLARSANQTPALPLQPIRLLECISRVLIGFSVANQMAVKVEFYFVMTSNLRKSKPFFLRWLQLLDQSSPLSFSLLCLLLKFFLSFSSSVLVLSWPSFHLPLHFFVPWPFLPLISCCIGPPIFLQSNSHFFLVNMKTLVEIVCSYLRRNVWICVHCSLFGLPHPFVHVLFLVLPYFFCLWL